MTQEFRFLEEMALADAAFEASGETPSELFMAAAQAVIDVMVNPTSVLDSWRRDVTLTNSDLASLLFDWLSEIVFVKDAEAVVFRKAIASVRSEQNGAFWSVTGTLIGAPINPLQQELRADVKAVTKHLYEVVQEAGKWRARVVLDI